MACSKRTYIRLRYSSRDQKLCENGKSGWVHEDSTVNTFLCLLKLNLKAFHELDFHKSSFTEDYFQVYAVSRDLAVSQNKQQQAGADTRLKMVLKT